MGLVGLFCLMIILFIISTDDQRIYGSVTTFVQDCIVPFVSAKTLTPERHIKLIKICAVVVGLIYLVASYYMSQLDYIKMFVDGVFGIWLSGCGPMFLFGFYSRFGTAAGAWVSLATGSLLSFLGVLLNFCWAGTIYPFLAAKGWADPIAKFFLDARIFFDGYLFKEMSNTQCPINTIECNFFATLISILLYVVVSWLTYKEPYNLERMLHRGKYAVAGEEKPPKMVWNWRTVWGKLIGITEEYKTGDKIIAWGVFVYTYIYKFFICFVIITIVHLIHPLSIQAWSVYFLITTLVIPGIMAVITAFWFGYGGTTDLIKFFHDLKGRVANPLDNGMVEGGVSLDEVQHMEEIDAKKE
ncbi:MAG: hypothetical protein MJ016_07965 [Victivallaceae bacterium]|nr:hypothetical protein [Victivallaceae bacterium]